MRSVSIGGGVVDRSVSGGAGEWSLFVVVVGVVLETGR